MWGDTVLSGMQVLNLKLHLRENIIVGEGSGPHEMLRCVVERVVHSVSQDRSTYIVRVGRLLDPEDGRHCDPWETLGSTYLESRRNISEDLNPFMMPFCTKNLGNAGGSMNSDFIAFLNVRIVVLLHVMYHTALRNIRGGRCDDLKSRNVVDWCDRHCRRRYR